MSDDRFSFDRRLAAILAADVVGYSALIEENEDRAIAAVKALWANIVDPTARKEGGRIVKTMGDGVLAEFPSAVKAVQCAMSVQEATAAKDSAFPDGLNLDLRIGLHLGDVVIDGDDILGDGVNLASRLESLAQPGGICISATVHAQLAKEIAAGFTDSGEKTVKNITRPIRVYEIVRNGTNGSELSRNSGSPDRKPTVAIGTFTTSSQDETSVMLSQGCQQTTAAFLSNLTGLSLVSQKSTPDYLAEARLQVIGNRYRCLLELNETADDTPVLNTRLDGEIGDLFDTQDELASNITTTVRYAILEHEAGKASSRSDQSATLEQKLARAGQLMMEPDEAGWTEASKLLDDFLVAEPDDFMALSMQACALLREAICGLQITPADTARTIDDLLQKARQINGQSDFLHLVRAVYHYGVTLDLDAAMRAIDRSLDITPDYALALNSKALILATGGNAPQGLELIETIIPSLSGNRIFHRVLAAQAFCNFANGDYAAAIESAQRSLEQAPDYPSSLGILVAASYFTGSEKLRGSALKRLKAASPGLSDKTLRPVPFTDQTTFDNYRDGILTGLSET